MITISVDHNSRDPAYKQIYDQIVSHVFTGKLQTGDAIPPSREMASTLDVNFHTVNKAYRLLRDNGVISLSRNRRYIISSGNRDENAESSLRTRQRELINDAIARGFGEDDIVEIVREILMERSLKEKKKD
ncbi:MAG: GntR family transcriptional regulator [Thermoplasmataceae archaeon]